MSDPAQPELGAWGYLGLVLLGDVVGIPAALLAGQAPQATMQASSRAKLPAVIV